MKIGNILLVGTAIFTLGGCGHSSGWESGDQNDELTGEHVSFAKTQIVDATDKNAATEIEIYCTNKSGPINDAEQGEARWRTGKQQYNLILQLTSFIRNQSSSYDGSSIDSDILYRLSPNDSDTMPKSFYGNPKYNNVIGVRFYDLAYGATKVMSSNSQTDPARSNFKFNFGDIIFRYSAGGTEREVKVSLANPSVKKVAAACGWLANPAPTSQSSTYSNPANQPSDPTAPASQSPDVPMASASQDASNSSGGGGNVPMALASQPAVGQRAGANSKPSFDCGKASAPVDRMICSNARLAGLDQLMTARWNKLYHSSHACPDCSTNLLSEQRAWIHQKNACGDSSCVEAAYTKRISDLDGELNAQGQE